MRVCKTLACALFAAAPILIKYALNRLRAPDGAYSVCDAGSSSVFATLALCALCGVFAYFALKPGKKDEACDDRDDDNDEDEQWYDEFSETDDADGFENNEAGRDDTVEREYSELYESGALRGSGEDDAENGNGEKNTRPDITAAIEKQKAAAPFACGEELEAELSEADTADGEDDDFFGIRTDEAETDDLYENIPDTLPDGYSYTETDTEDDDADGEEDEESDFESIESPEPRIVSDTPKRVIAAVLLCASLCAAALISLKYTAVCENGVIVSKPGGKKLYEWSDMESVGAALSALSDATLTVKIKTADGSRFTAFSSGAYITDAGKAKFESNAGICAYIVSSARERGAEIEITDAQAIEEAFRSTDDEQYINEITGK